jgi:HEPN domain-containing protein
MNRVELQALSDIRLKEARSLLDAGFPDGAYYLAGYSVECALKACIAKRTKEHDFPDKKLANDAHIHDLVKLLELSKLRPLLSLAHSSIEDSWEIVQGWSEASRYQRREAWEADLLLKAIEDGSGGVFPWIKLHW